MAALHELPDISESDRHRLHMLEEIVSQQPPALAEKAILSVYAARDMPDAIDQAT